MMIAIKYVVQIPMENVEISRLSAVLLQKGQNLKSRATNNSIPPPPPFILV